MKSPTSVDAGDAGGVLVRLVVALENNGYVTFVVCEGVAVDEDVLGWIYQYWMFCVPEDADGTIPHLIFSLQLPVACILPSVLIFAIRLFKLNDAVGVVAHGLPELRDTPVFGVA